MASRKQSSASSAKAVKLSVVTAKVAASRDIDATKAGKAVRSYLRRHFADLESDGYKGLGKVKTAANDGNRWPEMPADFARDLIKKIG